MVSRFPSFTPVDYCFHPVHIKDDQRDILVPCGKCDGCRLHKANDWSFRLVDELENCPNSIFFTLTYNNKFLPKLLLDRYDVDQDGYYFYHFISDYPDNVRFNSVSVVQRNDGLKINTCFPPIPVQHSDVTCLAYASKKDIQLWLKLLRQKLFERFYIYYQNADPKDRGFFRYYIISEYGPTTNRPHYHGLLFPKNKEFAECLIEECLYQSWQMCDEGLFKQHTHYCNSGVSQYVTNYTTGFAYLPEVYKENKELRPFRLASKAVAIGYGAYDKEEVFASILRGDCSYTKPVARLGASYVFKYSKDYVHSLLPKCWRYGSSTSSRVRFVYGSLFKAVRGLGYSFDFMSRLFREVMHVSDYAATFACYKYLTDFGSSLDHYLYLLDCYYYHESMDALAEQYRLLEGKSFEFQILYYINFYEFVSKGVKGIGDYSLSLWYFLNAFGLSFSQSFDILKKNNFDIRWPEFETYKKEVSSIILASTKKSKFNELVGNSPHIV